MCTGLKVYTQAPFILSMSNATKNVSGYVTTNHDAPVQTAKAVRVNVLAVDGESVGSCDTVWLPRSIAANLQMRRVVESDGCVSYEFSATVPAWWVRKLDNRPAWVREGLRAPPFATRPF